MFSTKFDRAAGQQADAAIIQPKKIRQSNGRKTVIKLNLDIYLLK
jgi:hypothetical protein